MDEVKRELLVARVVVVDVAHLRVYYYSSMLLNQVHERDFHRRVRELLDNVIERAEANNLNGRRYL